MKGGREYYGYGIEYNVEKGKGKQHHLPHNIEAVLKNIKLGKKSKFNNKGEGKNIGEVLSFMELYKPPVNLSNIPPPLFK